MANQDTLAYSQVKAILGLVSEDYINKIPKKLIEYIDSKAEDVNYQIDLEKDMENQELLDKTINIIAFINYKYWSNDEEKNELLRIYSENDNLNKKTSNVKINTDIFNTSHNEDIHSKEMITYDNKVVEFFKKIINKIKSLFN